MKCCPRKVKNSLCWQSENLGKPEFVSASSRTLKCRRSEVAGFAGAPGCLISLAKSVCGLRSTVALRGVIDCPVTAQINHCFGSGIFALPDLRFYSGVLLVFLRQGESLGSLTKAGQGWFCCP